MFAFSILSFSLLVHRHALSSPHLIITNGSVGCISGGLFAFQQQQTLPVTTNFGNVAQYKRIANNMIMGNGNIDAAVQYAFQNTYSYTKHSIIPMHSHTFPIHTYHLYTLSVPNAI